VLTVYFDTLYNNVHIFIYDRRIYTEELKRIPIGMMTDHCLSADRNDMRSIISHEETKSQRIEIHRKWKFITICFSGTL
jgi:hypothetical protein